MTEVLQAQRGKSPHPEMLHGYPKANGFVCSIWPWAFLKQYQRLQKMGLGAGRNPKETVK